MLAPLVIPMSRNIIPYKPTKTNMEADNFLCRHGIESSEDLFGYDNWPEIITEAYTDPATGKLRPLSRFKSRKADYFIRAGYKHSLAFQKMIATGTGKLRCLIVEAPRDDVEAPDFRERVLDPVLKHPQFAPLTLSYNAQRGQTANSAHIHLLAFVPDSHEIKTRIKVSNRFYTVRDDVEAFTGAYKGQDIATGTRKLVQYHRNPRDQRYRNWGDSRAEALAEEYISHLERKESWQGRKSSSLAGVRNMSHLIQQITPEGKEQELAEFARYHERTLSPQAQKAIMAAKQAKEDRAAREVPYNPVTLPDTTLPDTPQTPSHTAKTHSTPDSLSFFETPPLGGKTAGLRGGLLNTRHYRQGN